MFAKRTVAMLVLANLVTAGCATSSWNKAADMIHDGCGTVLADDVCGTVKDGVEAISAIRRIIQDTIEWLREVRDDPSEG